MKTLRYLCRYTMWPVALLSAASSSSAFLWVIVTLIAVALVHWSVKGEA